MDEQYLTVKDVAVLKNCTEHYVRVLIERGELRGMEVSGLAAGQGGVQYRIPLSSLDERLQLKFKRRLKQRENELKAVGAENAPAEAAPISDDELTGNEREEIAFWKQTLGEWRTYRNTCGLSKEEADDSFINLCNIKHPDLKLNRRTLYRKWKTLNAQGETALADRRGKHGNHSRKLSAQLWDIFEAFYLDESQKSVKLCVTLTKLELERLQKEGVIVEIPELPAVSTFVREAGKIPVPYIEYFRHGLKSFIGKCEPYIKRMYENLEPNNIWVADNHTFDIMLYDGVKVLRLYLTAFMDVRTRRMTGWCVTDRPCSDATIFALRNGIERCGIPKRCTPITVGSSCSMTSAGTVSARKSFRRMNFSPDAWASSKRAVLL